MNLVSLLILPAVISLEDNNIRYLIAGVSLVVLLASIAFSKRKGGGFGEESDIVEQALEDGGKPVGASAGE
jgi:hypothetical protein